MARIMRINMTTQQVTLEEVAADYQGLGGRGLSSAIVCKEVPPLCIPIGPNNKLILAPGLLGGTSAPISGRISIGGKSPLTGTIKESNSGGQGAHFIARCGLKAIVVEGKPPSGKLYKLLVNKDGGTLSESPELKGMGNYDATAKLREQHGDKVACISIGPCGEMQMHAASIRRGQRIRCNCRHAPQQCMHSFSQNTCPFPMDNSHLKDAFAQAFPKVFFQ